MVLECAHGSARTRESCSGRGGIEDAPAVTAACQDAEIARWLAFVPQPYTEEDARFYIQDCLASGEDRTPFAIADAETGEVVGSIEMRINRMLTGHIGYWLAAEARGRGLTTEALLRAQPLGIRRARPGPGRAGHRPGEHRLAARRREGRLHARGHPALDPREQGRQQAGRRDVLAAPGRARLGGFLLPAPLRVERPEPLHPLGEWGVRDEHRREPFHGERVHRVERLGRRRGAELDERARGLESDERVGEPVGRLAGSAAAALSAANSRFGESSRWTSEAATGARTNRNPRWNQPARRLTSIRNPASTETVVWTRTSRFAMCTSSCARMPSSSAGCVDASSPALTVSDDPRGPRPAANARGWRRSGGRSAAARRRPSPRAAQRSTEAPDPSASAISLAPTIPGATRSRYQ